MPPDNYRFLAISNALATPLPHAMPVHFAEREVDRGTAFPDATSAIVDGTAS
jgi:hypothetical protein